MSKCSETNFRSSYNIKIKEIIVLLLASNVVVLVRNVNSENLFSLLFFWNVSIIMIYFLVKIPLVRTIEFANDSLRIITLFSKNEIKYDKIEMRIIKNTLRPLQEKILLKSSKKRFTIRIIDWQEYKTLIDCLKTNIENKYE
jgi:hypothetical protein